MAEHRRFWRVWQRYMDAASFVFIDETGANTSMVRHYGWHPRGERLVDAAPHGTPRPLWRGFAPRVLLPHSSSMDR